MFQSAVLHADETPVAMLKPGNKKTHRAYLWAYTPGAFEDLKAVVYDFCESRASEHARTFLGDWSGGLVCDDFSGYKASFGAAMPIEKRLALKAKFPDAEHPVVRIHPETGEKILFVNSSFTTHFTNYNTPSNVRFGLDKSPGSSQLLNYLTSQAMIPEYQVRFRWKKNSMAFWDNRSTQHYAVMDYAPCHRKMERTAIMGGATD